MKAYFLCFLVMACFLGGVPVSAGVSSLCLTSNVGPAGLSRPVLQKRIEMMQNRHFDEGIAAFIPLVKGTTAEYSQVGPNGDRLGASIFVDWQINWLKHFVRMASIRGAIWQSLLNPKEQALDVMADNGEYFVGRHNVAYHEQKPYQQKEGWLEVLVDQFDDFQEKREDILRRGYFKRYSLPDFTKLNESDSPVQAEYYLIELASDRGDWKEKKGFFGGKKKQLFKVEHKWTKEKIVSIGGLNFKKVALTTLESGDLKVVKWTALGIGVLKVEVYLKGQLVGKSVLKNIFRDDFDREISKEYLRLANSQGKEVRISKDFKPLFEKFYLYKNALIDASTGHLYFSFRLSGLMKVINYRITDEQQVILFFEDQRMESSMKFGLSGQGESFYSGSSYGEEAESIKKMKAGELRSIFTSSSLKSDSRVKGLFFMNDELLYVSEDNQIFWGRFLSKENVPFLTERQDRYSISGDRKHLMIDNLFGHFEFQLGEYPGFDGDQSYFHSSESGLHYALQRFDYLIMTEQTEKLIDPLTRKWDVEGLKVATHINGYKVEKIVESMVPNPSGSLSTEGMLIPVSGKKTKDLLIEQLIKDQKIVSEQLKMTHPQLVTPLIYLEYLTERRFLMNGDEFEFNGEKFRLLNHVTYSSEFFFPLSQNYHTPAEFVVERVRDGERIFIDGPLAYMAGMWGFYNGEGSPHRISPMKIYNFFWKKE